MADEGFATQAGELMGIDTWREETYGGALYAAAFGVQCVLLVPVFVASGAWRAARSMHVTAIGNFRSALECLERSEQPDRFGAPRGELLEGVDGVVREVLAGLPMAADHPTPGERVNAYEAGRRAYQEDVAAGRDPFARKPAEWPRGPDGKKLTPHEIMADLGLEGPDELDEFQGVPTSDELRARLGGPSLTHTARAALVDLIAEWAKVPPITLTGSALMLPDALEHATHGQLRAWFGWSPGDELARCGVCGELFAPTTAALEPVKLLEHVKAHLDQVVAS